MRAIVITKSGGPDVLQLREVATPAPGLHQVLIRVRATAVNRADLLQRRGQYPVPPEAPKDIPGLEYAGVVEACGESALRWSIGDRVMGIVGGGSYADYVVVHEDEALPIPEVLSFDEAAAIPEAFITADDALFSLMQLRGGESVLIHAAASGVDTAAVQLAHVHGAVTIGTSRHAEKLEQIRSLGLDHAIAASAADFTDAVLRISSRGVDGVLDLVGGPYLSANVQCAAPHARIVLVGLTAGRTAELDLSAILRKRLRIIGTVMRARSVAEKIAVARAFALRTLPLFASGQLRPVIDRVLPLERAADAHELLEANATVGKVVLGCSDHFAD